MISRGYTYRFLILAALLLCTLEAPAQTNPADEVVDRWLDRQRETLERLESMSVRTTVRHAVDTSVSTRVATYSADLTLRLPDDFSGPAGDGFIPPLRRRGGGANAAPPGRPPAGPPPGALNGPGPDIQFRLRWMTLDGDTLDSAYSRRVFQRLRSMLRPQTTRLLDDIGIPAAQIARLEPTGLSESDRISDQPALRIDTTPVGPPVRQLGISLWFDESGERLIATRLVMQFPGDRRLTAYTEYIEVGGLDLPVARIVDGIIPVPRRGRDVSLALDHRTRFTDYEFRFKDG